MGQEMEGAQMNKIDTGIAELLAKQPSDSAEKDAYIAELQKTVRLLSDEVRNMDELLALLRKKQFGPSSEQTKPTEEQLGLFNEAEQENKPDSKEPIKKDARGYHILNALEKWKLCKGIQIEDVDFDIPLDQRNCSSCGTQMKLLGKNMVREVPEFIPAKLKLNRYWQYTYYCPCCKKAGRLATKAIPAPKPLLNHSMASPSVVAEVIYQKYVNHVPLYRQEQEWKSRDVAFSRTTMANWTIRCAEDWLVPVWEAMRKELLRREVLHADETTVQVLKEKGKAPTTKSYMWLYCTGNDGLAPIVLYDYKTSRSGDNAKAFLEGFHGYLHTDGYAGYNKVPGITRCGCWAHLRRKFVEAMPPESNASTPAQIGRDLCDKLFAAEKEIQSLPPEQRQEKRLAVEQPMLKAFWCWLDELSTQPLAGSLKKAVEYAQGQRSYMENYLKDPRCEISNNRAENKIRPFTVGRKNWLFSDTPAGAKASAVIYSIVETAKANNLAPRDYIQFLFENLPDMEIQIHPERLEQMLPWGKLIQENFA